MPDSQDADGQEVRAPADQRDHAAVAGFPVRHTAEQPRHGHKEAADEENAVNHHQGFQPFVRFAPGRHGQADKECGERHHAIAQQIVIENNGIGYLINCPLGISAEIGGIGDEVTVYLYQSVKEDDISLYGFNSRDQKEMFLKLITVSGIGPKVAHTICASLSAEQIAAAVMSNNVALLTGVKGLGKKTAERIILELKDKLKAQLGGSAYVSATPAVMAVSTGGDTGVMQDAVGALVVLGYKDQEAAEAVAAGYEDGIGLEDLIRKALKLASGKKFS